jgi:hypothetical protein
MESSVRVMVLSVKVVATHASAVVADDDAIRIDHGNDFKYYSLT